MTCKEYQIAHKKDENDEKFEHFVKGMNLKKCPKCGAWVQKASGCDHIACKCGYAFCFNCGKSKGKERASLEHTCECITGALFRPIVMRKTLYYLLWLKFRFKSAQGGGVLGEQPRGARNQPALAENPIRQRIEGNQGQKQSLGKILLLIFNLDSLC